MGYTLIEKIIKKNAGLEDIAPGQIETVNVLREMFLEIFIHLLPGKLHDMRLI